MAGTQKDGSMKEQASRAIVAIPRSDELFADSGKPECACRFGT
jgi:hypothetical protein